MRHFYSILSLLTLSSLMFSACGQDASEAGPQGATGPQGVAGPAGESCRIVTSDEGVSSLTCDDGSSFELAQSTESGSCSVSSSEEDGSVEIICPDGSRASVPSATSGEDGAACRLEERDDDALYLVCDEGGEVELRPATSSPTDPGPTLTLLAGVTSVGTSDGIGEETRMDGALDGTFDAQGDFLYFVDTFNGTIRRFGVRTQRVVTLAGTPGRNGVADGVGEDASFDGPRGIALHPDGERIFIADGFNCTIRQLNVSTRLVTTLAGSAGNCDAVDGPLDQARFRLTIGMVMGPGGRYLYLSDRGNNVIRRIDLQEQRVETVAGELPTGSPGDVRGAVDGVGQVARFSGPGGIDISEDGRTLYVNDTFNNTIRAVSLEDQSATGGPDLFEVYTLAGMAGESGDVDGVGDAARFRLSQGLTRLGGQLYVAGFHGTIRRIDPLSGLVTTVAGSTQESGSADGPAYDARFGVSFGLIASPDGRNVYYMDRGNNSIRRFDTLGEEVTTVMGASEPVGWRDGQPGESRLDSPGQVWGSADGRRVYMIDQGNHVIRRFDRDTQELVTLAGLPGRAGFADGVLDEARFDSPRAIWVDPEEQFAYITDTDNSALRQLDLDSGEVSTLLGGPAAEDATSQDGSLETAQLILPFGLVGVAVDGAKPRLYVTEVDTNTVRLVDLESEQVTTVAGGGVRTGSINGMGLNAIFSDPVGLAIDQDANLLYVADQGHHLIRQIDLEDTSVTTLAGTLDEPDAFDGTGDDASFDAPAQIAFQDGTLYVADVGNHAIRQINISTAEVTTVVGTLGVSGGSGQRVLPLEQARLYFAAGVAVAPDGLFLTADEALMFATP